MSYCRQGNRVWLSVCREAIQDLTGVYVDPPPARSVLFLMWHVPAENEGGIPFFETSQGIWHDSDRPSLTWAILDDGKLFASYSDHNEGPVVTFKVRHPQEAAELVALYRQSANLLQRPPDPLANRTLGELVNFYALIPADKGHRTFPLDDLPLNIDCRFASNLSANLLQRKDATALNVSARFLNSLYPAHPHRRSGYVLSPTGRLSSAVGLNLARQSKSPGAHLLVVPRAGICSPYFLSEAINHDAAVAKEVRRVFAGAGSVHELIEQLKGTAIRIRTDLWEQRREAAEREQQRDHWTNLQADDARNQVIHGNPMKGESDGPVSS